jgi:hypothetical protein
MMYLLQNEREAMPQAKPVIDIKWSPFQEGYKGSTEALPPMRTVPATSVLTKPRLVPVAYTSDTSGQKTAT